METVLELLDTAVAARASDVYLIPGAVRFAITLRVDGGLQPLEPVQLELGLRWINYLKYRADMNVTEHRRVQLGMVAMPERGLTLRLSTVADFTGAETLVLRLLYGVPALDDWTRPLVAQLQRLTEHGGLLALAGSTGSGKTTLLYQLASTLAEQQMVMTIEDPVEIIQPAFLQLQVNPEADMTYAALLKAALRHRPDVLLIGEIRDFETAQQACEAAISGHVVLTTVHAQTAVLVRERLLGLGVAPSLVDAALTASGLVRLVQTPRVHPELALHVFAKEGGAIHETAQSFAAERSGAILRPAGGST